MQPLCAESQSQKGDGANLEQRIFYLLNQERRLAGLEKFEWNEHAAEAARRHAQLLAKNEKLSHEFSGEPSLRERLAATAIRFTSAAENVALADTADEAHLALMYSPGHRDNILNPEYSAVGIGVVEHAGRLYVAEDFILLVPAYTEDEFFALFVRAWNRLRQGRGMRAMFVQNDPALHSAACSTNGTFIAAPAKLGFSGELVIFTLSDPDRLPVDFAQRAFRSGFHQMRAGVCFRPDEKYGSGNFWVVVSLAM
jgi:hypothetical protein